GLQSAYRLDVVCGQLLHACQWQRGSVHTRRAKAEDRQAGVEVLHQLPPGQHLAVRPAEEEQRRLAVAGAQLHERGPLRGLAAALALDQLRQPGDGRALEQSREWEPYAQLALHLREQTYRHQRMSAEREE